MKQFLFRNKKIFYQVGGSGMPVMLVHGFAEDHDVWKYQFKKLAERFFVIAPDLPGSGKSEALEAGVSLDDYADALKGIAEKEIGHGNSFAMIGHSMGGYITLAFADRYPDKLNMFGLFSSTAYPDDDAKKEARKKGIGFIKNNGVGLFIETTTPNLFCDKTKNKRPQLTRKLITKYKEFFAGSLIQYYNAMMKRPDRIHVLHSFTKPVLFIIGKGDQLIPLNTALQQTFMPSVSFVTILQNAGHMGMWEEKKKSLLALEEFLLSYADSTSLT